jgi:hypothetical protein
MKPRPLSSNYLSRPAPEAQHAGKKNPAKKAGLKLGHIATFYPLEARIFPAL